MVQIAIFPKECIEEVYYCFRGDTMELTDTQREKVADFLRKQDESMGEVPADQRLQALTHIKQRVRDELLKVGKDVLSDARVDSVLERIHITVDTNAPDAQDDDRHWMGVCKGLSEQYGYPVKRFRIAFIVVGCLAPPLALLVYIGLLLRLQKIHPDQYPIIDSRKVLSNTLKSILLILGLHVVAWILIYGITYLYLRVLKQPVGLESWARLSDYNAPLCTVLLFTLGATAALSAMPLARQWDKTLTTLTHLGVALYVVLLCLGVALNLTGYVLSALNAQLG